MLIRSFRRESLLSVAAKGPSLQGARRVIYGGVKIIQSRIPFAQLVLYSQGKVRITSCGRCRADTRATRFIISWEITNLGSIV